MHGKLIVFEGIDGTGKSTQARLLVYKLKKMGHRAIYTFEPTKGKFGGEIRASYKSGRLPPEVELNLFVSDRREHLINEVIPALKDGMIVVQDRYFYSSIAYQGSLGIDKEKIMSLHAPFIVIPSLVFMLRLSVDECIKRIETSRGMTNMFEGREYLSNVLDVFNSFDDDYIKHLDASKNIKDLHKDILMHTHALF